MQKVCQCRLRHKVGSSSKKVKPGSTFAATQLDVVQQGQSQTCKRRFQGDYFVTRTLFFCCLPHDHHNKSQNSYRRENFPELANPVPECYKLLYSVLPSNSRICYSNWTWVIFHCLTGTWSHTPSALLYQRADFGLNFHWSPGTVYILSAKPFLHGAGFVQDFTALN